MFFRKRPKEGLLTEGGAPGPARLSPAREPAPAPSVIGRNSRFRGEVRGRGPLVIRGQVEGTVGIEDRLTVEAGGALDADARAGEALIRGAAEGDLEVRGTLAVGATGVVNGRIRARRLRVESGAILKGSVSRPEPRP